MLPAAATRGQQQPLPLATTINASADPLTAAHLTITPAIASQWLAHTNTLECEGPLYEHAATLLRTEPSIPHFVGWSAGGYLVCGAALLSAIWDTGIPARCVVVYGMPDPDFEQPAPPAPAPPKPAEEPEPAAAGGSISARLAREGVANAPVLAAAARRVLLWETRTPFSDTAAKDALPEHQIRAAIERHRILSHCAHMGDTYRHGSGVNGSLLAFAWWLLHRTGASVLQIDQFIRDLGLGAMLPEGDPVLVLRERLRNPTTGRDTLTETDQLALIITAWNARRADTRITRIRLPVGGTPETNDPAFPSPR
jgi:hypothetical protein